MEQKEYRAICWQPVLNGLNDEIFVDIVPADGVTHDMIFYSRLQIERTTQASLKIRDVAKSIFIKTVADEKLEIVFEKKPFIPEERLRALVLRTYEDMRAVGKDSTLSYLLSAPEAAYYASQMAQPQLAKHCGFAQKHLPMKTDFPQSPQEEKIRQFEEKLAAGMKHRLEAQQMHAERDAQTDPIVRMREKMRQYSGD